VLVIVHYAWAKKGSITQLQGDIVQPILFGMLVLVLLILRIPAVKQALRTLLVRLKG